MDVFQAIHICLFINNYWGSKLSQSLVLFSYFQLAQLNPVTIKSDCEEQTKHLGDYFNHMLLRADMLNEVSNVRLIRGRNYEPNMTKADVMNTLYKIGQ